MTIELGGLDARPRLVVVGPGSVIEIKNTGKVRHELSTPDTPQLMQLESLPPGGTRRQKFDGVGGFVIRDSEYPHIMISVIVVDSPYFSALDEKGIFLDRQRARRQGHPQGLDARSLGGGAGDRHGRAGQGRADREGRRTPRAASKEAKEAE